MRQYIEEYEEILKEACDNSIDDMMKYILYEISYPIEDYYSVMDLLEERLQRINDVRLIIIGSYLFSTWKSFEKNPFLEKINEIINISLQDRAVILYLKAYDIYMKTDEYRKSTEYKNYLVESVNSSTRFVNNYLRLAEVSNTNIKNQYLEKAIQNVEIIFDAESLETDLNSEKLSYEKFVSEFILGVYISKERYYEIIAAHDLLVSQIHPG